MAATPVSQSDSRGSHLEAALAFGNVLLWVEEDDVDFGHVQHPQRDGGGQAEGDGERGGLDVHLRGQKTETDRGMRAGWSARKVHREETSHGSNRYGERVVL